MHNRKIILASILAAVIYGIVHDLITAHLCVEYFTIGHPRLIDSGSPVKLALFWGVAATWWVGLIIGIALACAARRGSRPKLRIRHLWRPLTILLAWMFVVAILAGLTGYLTGKTGLFYLAEPFATRISPEKHLAFLTVAWAHAGSYLAGFVGGIVLCIRTWKRRAKVKIQIIAAQAVTP
ncbi:MAG TPA: hypothetical protein VHM91_22280 [Verrucomicrobiales bacterium]|nr:hypothetical protein [Verrucomicrobiales bacterium]